MFFIRDWKRFCQFELSEMWIRIAIWEIRVAFFSLNFLECGFESLYERFESSSSNLFEKLQNWRVNWGIRIVLLGIRIWSLENNSKCSFVKIFLGIFIYILKHLLSLISKHNMSIFVSSKSARIQQREYSPKIFLFATIDPCWTKDWSLWLWFKKFIVFAPKDRSLEIKGSTLLWNFQSW